MREGDFWASHVENSLATGDVYGFLPQEELICNNLMCGANLVKVVSVETL